MKGVVSVFPGSWFARLIIAGCLSQGSIIFADENVAEQSAYETVQLVTDQLLKKLAQVKPLYETDRKQFYMEVDSSLESFIDFNGFSRGVMAKYYRRTNDNQRELFNQTFRAALIETYSKALVEFDTTSVLVKPEAKAQKDPKKARVSLEVHSKNGSIHAIEYSVVLLDGQWKLRNVMIDGFNMGLQFRSQFAAYMQKYKNNIDKVIENWNVDA